MEFPAYRVAVEEAPVLHELTHVYFPNSNRFLAEGIAVYMQHEHGTSIAYPDFGTDLDLILKEEFGSLLGQLRVAKLDQITTPMNLLLRVRPAEAQGRTDLCRVGLFREISAPPVPDRKIPVALCLDAFDPVRTGLWGP